MVFLNKFFTGTAKDEAETLSEEKIKVRVASRPMRKLKIVFNGNEEEQGITSNNSLLKLKELAEKIRHRVHYIDKNDFAKKAVSNKDKVYDYDLRKDLAYFLANERLFVSDEIEAVGGRAETDLNIFEELIRKAISDERVGYVVYGERTYIVERETQNVEHGTRNMEQGMRDTKHVPASTRREDNTLMRGGTRNVQQKAENSKQEAVNERKETQNTKQVENEQMKKQAEEEGVAGLSREDVEVFSKNAGDFLKGLERESENEVDTLITKEEQKILTRIFTKRFLREIILEKEAISKTKMFKDEYGKEKFVEFICESVFK